ncbi:hypothetical protein [Nocardia sp. SYP-A9097]|uniref:hypothetical protein n=1 Tax=Nocardia sp. SYP-A9097 TaxID=2663237 RepID=UPI001E2F233A|nr:hypothetical protein [Nocardia sp. SYP-A9097]
MNNTATLNDSTAERSSLIRLQLSRGVLAIAWALAIALGIAATWKARKAHYVDTSVS